MNNETQCPQTDIDKLKALLSEFGVGFEVTERDERITIECEQGAEKVSGYFGFTTLFTFSSDGKFMEMGAYE